MNKKTRIGTPAPEKQHVYFIGAHPDDMIACAAFALAISSNPRFRIHVVDYTRGGAGIAHLSRPKTERIRTAEETRACAMLGVRPVFIEEPDGRATAGRPACEALARLFRRNPPRAVFTHWPVDVHVDHTMCYAAVVGALRISGILNFRNFGVAPELYFFEESMQTRSMPVRHYFPFDQNLMDRKLEFIRCYAILNGTEAADRKLAEARYHGWQCGRPYAEPYGSPLPALPHSAPAIFDEL